METDAGHDGRPPCRRQSGGPVPEVGAPGTCEMAHPALPADSTLTAPATTANASTPLNMASNVACGDGFLADLNMSEKALRLLYRQLCKLQPGGASMASVAEACS